MTTLREQIRQVVDRGDDPTYFDEVFADREHDAVYDELRSMMLDGERDRACADRFFRDMIPYSREALRATLRRTVERSGIEQAYRTLLLDGGYAAKQRAISTLSRAPTAEHQGWLVAEEVRLLQLRASEEPYSKETARSRRRRRRAAEPLVPFQVLEIRLGQTLASREGADCTLAEFEAGLRQERLRALLVP